MIPAGSLVLLDTNVLVQLVRGRDAGRRIDEEHQLTRRPDRPLISIVTVGEARSLALKLGWDRPRRSVLDELLRHLVIVSLDSEPILDCYAEIDHYSERGARPARPMGKNDVWIAATAAATGAWLLTGDHDFDHLAPRFLHRVKVDARTGATID